MSQNKAKLRLVNITDLLLFNRVPLQLWVCNTKWTYCYPQCEPYLFGYVSMLLMDLKEAVPAV